MEILDEELLQTIINSPEYQTTFQKYKGQLIINIWIYAIIFIVFIVAVFFHFNSIVEEASKLYLIFYVFVTLCCFLFFLKSLIYSVRDLNLKKLDIQSDVFVKPVVKETQNGANNFGLFQEQGEIFMQPYVISKFVPNTKVYILRAAYSKTVLDIIPIDKIEKTISE